MGKINQGILGGFSGKVGGCSRQYVEIDQLHAGFGRKCTQSKHREAAMPAG